MKIQKFLATIFNKQKPNDMEIYNRFEAVHEAFAVAQSELDKQEMAQKEEALLAQLALEQVEKEKLAKQAIERDIGEFIQQGKLSTLNAYVKAGYPLTTEDFQFMVIKQPQWLVPAAQQIQLDFSMASTIQATPVVAEKNNNAQNQENNPDKDLQEFQHYIKTNCQPLMYQFITESLQTFSLNKLNPDLCIGPERLFNFTQHLTLKFVRGVEFLNGYHRDFTPEQKEQFYQLYRRELPILKTQQRRMRPGSQSADNLYMPLYPQFEKSLLDLQLHIDTYYSDFEKNALTDKLASIQQLYQKTDSLEHVQVGLKNSLAEKIDKFQRNSISLAAWKKIENIKSQGEYLTEHLSELGVEDQMEVKNLTKNVLVEVIHEYMAISPQHKAHLKNEAGQGLDELFMESLTTIEEQLMSKSQNLAENQFKEVKITHQYLKAKR